VDAGVPEVARRVRKTRTEQDTVRIGITGHMDLEPATTRLIIDELRVHLRALIHERCGRIVGVSCLAPGADRVFAHVLLEFGGTLEAIFPSGEYDGAHSESSVVRLLRRAASIRTIDHPRDRPQAYVAANEAMLDSIDSLFAVWNGIRSGKPGGTAHVVERAWSRRIPVTVIWPEGASRLS
jgi:hypothetical protein